MEEMLWGDLEVWIIRIWMEIAPWRAWRQGICRDLTKDRNGEKGVEILSLIEAAAHRRSAVGQQPASRLLTHG